jgi:hypothetical protein
MDEVDAQRNKVYQRAHNIHHEAYDDNDVLSHTIEACPACHRRVQNNKTKGFSKFGSLHKNERRTDPIRITMQTYDKLSKLGSSKHDNDDVIFILMQDHDELKKLR